jgi:uncharacterized protein YkwD
MYNANTDNHILKTIALLIVILTFSLTFQTSGSSYAYQNPPECKIRQTFSVSLPLVVQGLPQNSLKAPEWLDYLNYYRGLADLPPLTEDTEWSLGSQFHARYTVKNDILIHNEDLNNQWYTPEGRDAAQSGNLMASYDVESNDQHAIDVWMQAPFHALGILDPRLQKVGFGSYREADGGLQMGATMDVLRGRGEIPLAIHFPIMWPAKGAVVPLSYYWGEYPDPLTSCPGYTSPSGLPIILQVGSGALDPVVNSHIFLQDKTPLENCVFTESTYANPDQEAQDLGRAILDYRDAIVLVPREPLASGTTYTVSMVVDGISYTWTFETAGVIQEFQDLSLSTEIR